MDKQIFLNYLVVFVLPLLLGGGLRFFCYKFSKAWLITVAAMVLSVAAWFVAMNPPVLGSELYALRTVQAVCLTIGSLLTGLFVKIRKKTT